MHRYAQDISEYPLGLAGAQVNFGMHRVFIQSDDGSFFGKGSLLLRYLYNDAGDPIESRIKHFEEIKKTFHKIRETG